MDWKEARSGTWHFVATVRIGAFEAVAIWIPRMQATIVVWREGERREVCGLTREEELIGC
jgi:hypothetical protein